MIALLSLSASACTSDVKNIERINYATAIGVDYKDGEYYGYIQFIDLQSEAKTAEGNKSDAHILIGESKGKTFEESFFNLYRTSQERIYWGHMTALLISDSAIKHGIDIILDSVTRYYEFRLTPYIFATRGSVKEILNVGGFYGQSSLSTLLHEPEGNYSQTSLIHSLRLHRLISDLHEPGFTTCIPTLAINRKQWMDREKSKPMLYIDGAVFYQNESYRGYIPLKQLDGLRWIQEGAIRSGIAVPNSKEASVHVVIENPTHKIKIVPGGGNTPQYDLHIRAVGFVTNRLTNEISEMSQLTEATKAAIEEEIRGLHALSVKTKTDIFNLEYKLFRNRYKLWKSNAAARNSVFESDSLRNIEIDLNIRNTGSLKNRVSKPVKLNDGKGEIQQ